MVPGQNGNMAQLQRVNFGSDPTQQLTALTNGNSIAVTSPTTNGHAQNASISSALEQSIVTAPTAPMSTGENSQASDEPEEEEEPLYVNAKQYNRILKRRMARAKLENDGRIPRTRQVRFDI